MSAPLYTYPQKPIAWTQRDVLLFALSIGCSPDELHYQYEHHPDFATFPTYPTILTFKHNAASTVDFHSHFRQHLLPPPGSLGSGFPALDIAKVVDGARTLEILRQLPTSSKGRVFEIKSNVFGVRDAGPGKSTIIQTEHLLFERDHDGDEVPYTRMTETAIFMSSGGWGGPTATLESTTPLVRLPDASPTATFTHDIPANQHLLYRLNGDYNPLHARAVSEAVVQPTPIMHGLYSWNVVAHGILAAFTRNTNPHALQAFRARFASPVRPGDVLETKMWLMPKNISKSGSECDVKEVRFETRVDGKLVLADGTAALNAELIEQPHSVAARL